MISSSWRVMGSVERSSSSTYTTRFNHLDDTHVSELLVGSRVRKLLEQLLFPVSTYSPEDIVKFVDDLKKFVIYLNEVHRICEDDTFGQDFSEISLCEPWLPNFLQAVIDIRGYKLFTMDYR